MSKSFFIPVANPNINKREVSAVNHVMKKKWLTMGKKVEKFESDLAKYLGVRYVVAMNNGTSTLDCLVKYFNVSNSNHEVIVPDMTYISTANVVRYNLGKVVLCDCDNDFNIRATEIEKKITKNTKLIIVTDMKGCPVDYDSIKKIAKKYNIPLIADSAEALGAEYKGKKVGSQVFAHSFSFFANKNITTGEGGAISTNSRKLYNYLKVIRNQGQSKRYHHIMIGNNYRMTDISASIGIEQLKKISEIIKNKNKIAKFYINNLKKISEITLPEIPSYVTQHSWYNFTIVVNKKIRNKLIKFLAKKKIETRVSFPTISMQPVYKKVRYENNSNSVRLSNALIDLPIWSLLDKKKQNYIIKQLHNFFDDQN